MENLATPMMRQYRRLKQEHPDCLLLFRCGDFYETYFEDAEEAGRLLNIVVTRKTAGVDGDVAMAGVPYHAIETYLARLVRAGRSVAIAEQMEDPKTAKGLVRRDIVRVVTPGTALEPGLLEDRSNNYLVAVVGESSLDSRRGQGAGAGAGIGAGGRAKAGLDLFEDIEVDSPADGDKAAIPDVFGVAIVELSTGDFAVTEFSGVRAREEFLSELVRLEPSELLLPEGTDPSAWFPQGFELTFRITRRPADRFDPVRGRRLLARQLGVQTLEGYGAGDLGVGLGAAGAVLDFLHETQKGSLPHIHELRVYRADDCMVLDATTQRSLELVHNLQNASRESTVLSILDHTRTAMGGRLLRHWLLKPLGRREAIEQRLGAVEELFESLALRSQLGELLRGLPDMERVGGRIACARAAPRDLAAIRVALERLPRIQRALESARATGLTDLRAAMDPMPELHDRLVRALVDEPPLSVREGGIIRPGWSPALDEIKSVAQDTRGWINAFRGREAQRLNLPNLKIGFNKVFGYYIELTKAQLRQLGELPADYQRKQTIANGERYITPELKEKEEIILHAEERINGLEMELFEQLRAETAEHIQTILAQARLLARLDTLLSLAEAALAGDYVRPGINEDGRLMIRQGRHPVLEAVQVDPPFVPNDTLLDPDERQIALITGPNMAGKSTYIRQVALIALLAHVGSFVPAREADICVLDRIFTRVGAMDHLARGQSTFLVEMIETANILNNATDDSLVILDEIGRGTSTYDGMSIAWAVLEHLHNTPGRRPKTLFATHYHELTDLEGRLPRLKNFNVAVLEEADRVVFLYRIVHGPADRSYGIYAAKLAGVPLRAVRRAKRILKDLENGQVLVVDSGGLRPEELEERGDETNGDAIGARAEGDEAKAESAASASGGTEPESVSGKPLPRRKGRLGFLSDFEARRVPTSQLSLFDAPPHPALERLKAVQLERMTPLEAMNLLYELRRMIEK